MLKSGHSYKPEAGPGLRCRSARLQSSCPACSPPTTKETHAGTSVGDIMTSLYFLYPYAQFSLFGKGKPLQEEQMQALHPSRFSLLVQLQV